MTKKTVNMKVYNSLKQSGLLGLIMQTFPYIKIGIQTLAADSFQEILPFSEILNFFVFLDVSRHVDF